MLWDARELTLWDAGEQMLWEGVPIVCRLIYTHDACCFRFRPLHGKKCGVCRSAARLPGR